jgi:hypothetical protein
MARFFGGVFGHFRSAAQHFPHGGLPFQDFLQSVHQNGPHFLGDLLAAESRMESAVISFNIPARTVSIDDQQFVNTQPSL